jgi:hypothetical protein
MLTLRFVLPVAVLSLAITAKATTYQITIYPQHDTNFFGPGEGADDFTSNHWNITETGANAPPMFSYAQITFTTPDINNAIAVNSPNVQAYISELNNQGPFLKGLT